ncbi:hypothetical protein HYP99_gp082 [Sinorhizobium phage ort11]|uniref:Uncharacterized protein n=1 Tax=Sinorhizobium phage ort11 TaxID=2599764 RepID=A0A5C2H251_9CAUD|nr:hypothetical protein HYP99_gp082 [Sinorhizobium phage ort11]QEP29880.1 hypothetical protein Smphiort11_082 [Sinorhizobium phage ort11]
MTQLPLDQAIPRFKGNEERVDKLVNGTDLEVWSTANGVVLPTFAKFLKDKEAEYDLAIAGPVAQAQAAADASASSAAESAASATAADASADAAQAILEEIQAGATNLVETNFVGDGIQTDWTLTYAPKVDENLLVWVGGAIQDTTDYSVTGTTLTITPAVPNLVKIRTLIIATATLNEIEDAVLEAQAAAAQALSVANALPDIVNDTMLVDEAGVRVTKAFSEVVEKLQLTYIKDLGSHDTHLRKFRTTYVDPSNWSSVLQAAADSGEPCIRVHADSPVTFQEQWSIETSGQKWVGDGMDNKSYLNRTVDVDEPAILVMGERCGMRHIGVRGTHATVPTSDQNTGILVARPSGEPVDLDFEFRDGYISKFYYAVDGKGRGITVADSLISAVRYGVNFDMPPEGTYTKDRFVGDSDTNGFRRQVVRGCEFHSISVAGVRNRGWNAANIKCVVQDNTSNFGKAIFVGKLGDGSAVLNNTIMNANFNGYELDGGTNYIFAGNSMVMDYTPAGSPGPMTTPESFIKMTGQHTGFILKDFVGVGCTDHGIDMRNGDFKGILRNIDLADVNKSGGSFVGVVIIGTGSATEIICDGVTLRNSVAPLSVVRATTAGSVVKHRGILGIGATILATSGSATFTTY